MYNAVPISMKTSNSRCTVTHGYVANPMVKPSRTAFYISQHLAVSKVHCQVAMYSSNIFTLDQQSK